MSKPPRKKRNNDLSDFEKGFITALHREEYPNSEIRDKLKDTGFSRWFTTIKKYSHAIKIRHKESTKKIIN